MQQDYLANLHDIQPPEPITAWPLAWGWYALILVVVLLSIWLIRKALHFIKQNRAKKQAIAELTLAQKVASPEKQFALLNQILKRACLAYTNRESVAALTGEPWAMWLNSNGPKGPKFEQHDFEIGYSNKLTHTDVESFRRKVEAWVLSNLPLTKKLTSKATRSTSEASDV